MPWYQLHIFQYISIHMQPDLFFQRYELWKSKVCIEKPMKVFFQNFIHCSSLLSVVPVFYIKECLCSWCLSHLCNSSTVDPANRTLSIHRCPHHWHFRTLLYLRWKRWFMMTLRVVNVRWIQPFNKDERGGKELEVERRWRRLCEQKISSCRKDGVKFKRKGKKRERKRICVVSIGLGRRSCVTHFDGPPKNVVVIHASVEWTPTTMKMMNVIGFTF